MFITTYVIKMAVSGRPTLDDYEKAIDKLGKLSHFQGKSRSKMISQVEDEMSEQDLLNVIKDDEGLDRGEKLQLFRSLKDIDMFSSIEEDFEGI